MKIAYLLDTFPSASETFIAREIEALRRRGFVIEIFALRAGTGAVPLMLSSPWLTASKLWRKRTRATACKYFEDVGARWWREVGEAQKIEHIHAGWASHPAQIAWGAARAAQLPWSFSGHARDLFVEHGKENHHLAALLGAAEFATSCTRAGEQFLRECAPDQSAKVFYVPHGIEVARYPYRERIAPAGSAAWQLLSVGRLVEKKGFGFLLEALALLREQGILVQTTIIGDGPLRSTLEKQIVLCHLRDVVTLAGALPHQQVIEKMKGADSFVLPCVTARDGDRDGLPNVLLEAAACGLPLVSTSAGSVTDFLDEQTGWLCPPADANALAAALQTLRASAADTRRRALAARQRVETAFDVDCNVKNLACLFQARA